MCRPVGTHTLSADKLMKITLPEGFEVPPETEEEGEFTVLATFKDNGDGTAILLKIDGSKVKGGDDDDDDEKKEPDSAFGRAKAAGYEMKMM